MLFNFCSPNEFLAKENKSQNSRERQRFCDIPAKARNELEAKIALKIDFEPKVY
jgi:hypothetical protein